ncbi:hypothetical protein [Halocella sp. SP3-1]|uniref:hypothetical protein n=1 Tax=Halocella sp. SP3-1 TaxID=2382161 RepID=UPI000F74EF97|nr:hypothetical protein [Halocella sp. SP3-1]AZO95454.1 hypothetical protein D7D81_13100 [Halocella sp. SP3-1]MTI60619.1 hypothetical protein [Bacillota bacterium]
MIDINNIVEKVLSNTNSAVVKYKIMIEIFDTDKNDTEIKKLRKELDESKRVQDIISEQREDGSWGRFHSQNTKIKQKYKTTESAIIYLSNLGLKRGDRPVDKACNYMEELLNKRLHWPDAWEKNKWFLAGVDLFITSKLSMFGCEDEKYNDIVEKWSTILFETLSGGEYKSEVVNEIAKEIIGVDIHNSYIGLNSINCVILLTNNRHRLSDDLQKKYLNWLHTYEKNVFYTTAYLKKHPKDIVNVGELSDWIVVMTYLSKLDGFYEEFKDEINWLLRLNEDNDFWDLGKALTKQRLSDNWRKQINRKIDQTVYILGILKNCNIK